jgi:hypothetical protein
MIHDDLDARKPLGHVSQHQHLVRRDEKVEHRAEPFGLAPERIL